MEIAMIGLGKMGANMAKRLLQGGHCCGDNCIRCFRCLLWAQFFTRVFFLLFRL